MLIILKQINNLVILLIGSGCDYLMNLLEVAYFLLSIQKVTVDGLSNGATLQNSF